MAVAVSTAVVALAPGAVEVFILVVNTFCLDSSLVLEAVWWRKLQFWQQLCGIKCVVREEILKLYKRCCEETVKLLA